VNGAKYVGSAAGILLVAGLASAQSPDFSGMWTLDREASDYTAPAFSGGRGGDDIGRLFITHAAVERDVRATLGDLRELDAVRGMPALLRVINQ